MCRRCFLGFKCLSMISKALGEEVKDKDFSHKFLRCLPSRFGTLVTILVRSGLDTMTPNQVLGDIMTDDTYRDEDEKEEKKEKKDEKKKSVAFKATSSKGKAKQETSSEDDDSWDDDDEKMALFVKRFGKFMVKKGYRARRRSLHPRTKKNQEGASNVEAKIILLLNVHTIATMMMTRRRKRRRIRRKRKRRTR